MAFHHPEDARVKGKSPFCLSCGHSISPGVKFPFMHTANCTNRCTGPAAVTASGLCQSHAHSDENNEVKMHINKDC